MGHTATPGKEGNKLLCQQADLVENSGVCALFEGEQIALFYLPHQNPPVYCIGNFDPKGGANVLSRGIVGDQQGELAVASPLYKHHYSLLSGRCLEDDTVEVRVYPVVLEGGAVFLLRD